VKRFWDVSVFTWFGIFVYVVFYMDSLVRLIGILGLALLCYYYGFLKNPKTIPLCKIQIYGSQDKTNWIPLKTIQENTPITTYPLFNWCLAFDYIKLEVKKEG